MIVFSVMLYLADLKAWHQNIYNVDINRHLLQPKIIFSFKAVEWQVSIF